MGFLSRAIEQRSTISLKAGDPAISGYFGGNVNASGQNVTPNTALRTSAVYCCVSVLSETLASFPLQTKRIRDDGGKDLATSHRCSKLLLYRPNRWQSSFEFIEMMEGHRLLRGNGYAKIVFHPGRGLNELVPMHPDYIFPFVITPEQNTYYLSDTTPCPPAGSTLFYHHFPLSGNSEVLTSDEVLHIRDYTINGIVGISRIKWAAYQAVGLAMATEEHGAKLFSNGAQIGKVFRHPMKLRQDAYDRLTKQLNAGGDYAGSANAHRTMILEEGMDIAKIGMTAEESQFLETRKFQIEDFPHLPRSADARCCRGQSTNIRQRRTIHDPFSRKHHVAERQTVGRGA